MNDFFVTIQDIVNKFNPEIIYNDKELSEIKIRTTEVNRPGLQLVDFFDYFDNSAIGKPTGNDMREGKLTLPVIHVLNSTKNEEMNTLARRVKQGDATQEEIAQLVAFTKENGGIEYATHYMAQLVERAHQLLAQCADDSVRLALTTYIDYVVKRNK